MFNITVMVGNYPIKIGLRSHSERVGKKEFDDSNETMR